MAILINWKITLILLVVFFVLATDVDTQRTLRPEVKKQIEEMQKNFYIHEDDFEGSILEFVPKVLRWELANVLSFEMRLTDIDAKAVNTIQQMIGKNNLNTIIIKNNLTRLTKELFVDKTLTTLDFSQNQLLIIEDDAFLGLENVTRLDLDQNHISQLSNGIFNSLSNFKVLHFCANHLTTVNSSWFPINSTLEFLFLSQNRIHHLAEASFENLPNLSTLHLARNNLQTLHGEAFKGLRSLNQLVLRHNSIKTLPQGIFHGLPELTYLELQSNLIEYLHPQTFATNTKLSNIVLEDNKLTSLFPDTFQHLTKLQFIDLNNNQLVDFDFSKIKAIDIRIYDNKMTELKFNEKATHIKAQNNSIENIIVPENAELYDLQVKGNKIQDLINITRISTLEALYISHNGITSLPVELHNLKRLQIFDLSHNQLTPSSFDSWSPEIKMASLNELWINDNQFSQLPTNFLEFFPQLKYLEINENPWNETFITEFRQKCLDRKIKLIDSKNLRYSDSK